MRALTLLADRKLELTDTPPPAAPAAGEVQIRIKAVALNHLDLWGYRGMAFAKRKMPVVVGVEAAGEIAAVGPGTAGFMPGDSVVMYGALTCGTCKACREGRDNLCENVGGIMGFHIDGFARDLVNMPARLVIPVPKGVSLRDAACAPIAFATVQPMAFAILIATEPMPEPAACTRMVSPGLSLALSNSMCSVVPKAIGAQAASRSDTPSGTGITRRAGRLINSRAKPSM